jgi:hypothetical protein
LLGACSGGGDGGGGFNEPVPGTPVTVSGTVRYQFVPPNAGCSGLNFSATVARPIRGATVVLLNNIGGEMARMSSSDSGAYSFANVAANTSVRIRVLAETKSSGLANWDVEVRDNVDTSGSPPPLQSRPMYSIESSLFDTGSIDSTRNLTAETGWNGSSYTDPRAAAPFAILDTIYTGTQFMVAVDPNVSLPPLDVFWSVNNTAEPSDLPIEDAIDAGELGGSFYVFGTGFLFLTGDAAGDTDEFDTHIVGHEWVHFLDDTIFRSDSLGGTHFLGDKLDSRLAWGEGWPSALAAMFLNDPSYCETGTPGTNAGFEINSERGFFGGQGWFDEVGINRFVYDLWDTDNEDTDTGSVGFQPIYDVMVGGQRTTQAWANIYTFAVELKALVDVNGDALIDSQLGDEQTVQGAQLDIWGSNETNDGGANNPDEVLPIYIDMVADGTVTNICSNSQFDPGPARHGNKLSEYRYIRLNVPMDDEYHVVIRSTTPTPDTSVNDSSDPDMHIYRDGVSIRNGDLTSGTANLETTDLALDPSRDLDERDLQSGPILMSPGIYVADLRDWRYADPDIAVGYPPEVCFDVQFIPTP